MTRSTNEDYCVFVKLLFQYLVVVPSFPTFVTTLVINSTTAVFSWYYDYLAVQEHTVSKVHMLSKNVLRWKDNIFGTFINQNLEVFKRELKLLALIVWNISNFFDIKNRQENFLATD